MQYEKLGRFVVRGHSKSQFDNVTIQLQQKLCVYLVPFSRYSELFIESRQFYLPHPHLVRDDPIGISPKCLESENHSPCATVWRCLRDPMFSRLTITPTCDGQTDRQTDTGTQRQHA